MKLQINALDTLFFRDGKPFSLGDETWADGIFPPNPSVLYGALRTYIATKKRIPFEEVENRLQKVSIRHIGFEITLKSSEGVGAREKYLPLPADCAEKKKEEPTQKQEKRSKKYEGIVRLAARANPAASSLSERGLQYVFLPDKEPFVESIADGLIMYSQLISYLRAEKAPTFARKISDFVLTESKVGNGREDTHTVKEGSLYRVGMKRVSDLSVLMTVEQADDSTIGPEDIDGAMVKLGAEGKLVTLSPSSDTNFDEQIRALQIEGDYFKVYLSTPAIFVKNGWYPDLAKFGIEATLVGACMGKPKSIGGFNMIDKHRRVSPKPMYKAVPAGSVFFFKKEGDISFSALQGISLSEVYDQQGYGISFFGNFNPDKQ